MPTFHAPRHLIEHPSLVFDFLRARGIAIEEDAGLCGRGFVRSHEVIFTVSPKRFCGNLSFAVYLPPGRVSVPEERTENSIREYLTKLTAVRKVWDEVTAEIGSILKELNAEEVSSPLEAELRIASCEHGHRGSVMETVAAIHEKQTQLSAAVDSQNFEIAAHYRDDRERLLDRLYELCITQG